MFGEIFQTITERGDWFGELFVEHILISVVVIAVSIITGGVIGIVISENDQAAKPILGVVNFLYTIPSISMLGFLIPIFGVGNMAAIAALTIYALLPIVRNTYTGMKQIETGILEAAVSLGLKPRHVLTHIKIPLAMPMIMAGVRNMTVMTVSLAGIASFIGAGGLGVAIYRGITTNNVAMTVTGSLLIAFLALAADYLLGVAEVSLNYRERISASNMTVGKKFVSVIGGLLVVYAASNMNFDNRDTIRVATKPMTEQYILGEILKSVIEEEVAVKVELTSGVGGGTSNIHPAMVNGEFDIYPEYTGTAWNMVLKHQDLYDESKFAELNAAYQRDYQMVWLGMYGFNDTYGVVVRKEIADRYSLKTYSDLSEVSSRLSFGAEYDFYERADGYDALCEVYNLNFGKTMDLDIGLKYQALANNQIDVMIVFTTDGQLSESDAVMLVEDKGFFPSYVCGNVVRAEIVDRYPKLRGALQKLTGSISDGDMARMNFQVENVGLDPAEVARQFLQSQRER